MQEIEAKFAEIDPDALRQNLAAQDFVCVYPERLMRRKIFLWDINRPDYYARVRDEGDRVTMTIKEIVDATIHGVNEAEVVIDDFDQGVEFMTMCGWQQKSYQETRRELWCHKARGVEVMIDTWPGIPTFCEVEGNDAQSVRDASEALGFDWEQAFFGAVDVLFMHHLNLSAAVINTTPVITFDQPPK